MKRAAEKQINRDSRDQEEEFVTTPQIADEETMKKRKILKVRRAEKPAEAKAGDDGPKSAALFASAIKNSPTMQPAAPPLAGATGGAATNPFAAFAGSLPSANQGFQPVNFFDQKKDGDKTDGDAKKDDEKPKFSFSFGEGKLPAPTAAAPATPNFGDFGKQNASDAKPAAPAASFGLAANVSADTNGKKVDITSAPSASPFQFSFQKGSGAASFAAVADLQKKAKETGGGEEELGADVPFDPKETYTNKVLEEKRAGLLPSGAPAPSTGEEGEQTETAVTCRLYELIEGQWKERGNGKLKLNVHDVEGGKRSRLVMRNEKTGRAMLNVSLDKSFKLLSKETDPQLMCAAVVQDEGASAPEPKSYLLKAVKGSADAAAVAKDLYTMVKTFQAQ